MRTSLNSEKFTHRQECDLVVSLRLQAGGAEVEREPVTAADLATARSEAWLAGCLRQGRLDVPLEDAPMRLVPVRAKDFPQCTGFAFEVDRPGDGTSRRKFELTSLQHVASRAAQRLIVAGILQPNDVYFFKLLAEPRPLDPSDPDPSDPDPSYPEHSNLDRPNPPGPAAPGAPLFAMQTRAQPLLALEVPLAIVMQGAEPVGDVPGDAGERNDYPVFYTEEAFRKAERYARLGAASVPAVETGAVLVGSLCSCPETGELFAVICDALEARDTEQTAATLFYSGKSWARIQAIMRARQAEPTMRSQRLVGQAHGHNFYPSVTPPCAACEKAPTCRRTSVFVSADDLNWTRAVFHGQPWQLCHVFGLSARGEPVHGLFGLQGGSLAERGFHVIPEFDAAAWPLSNGQK